MLIEKSALFPETVRELGQKRFSTRHYTAFDQMLGIFGRKKRTFS
jgi:hypothetical protein